MWVRTFWAVLLGAAVAGAASAPAVAGGWHHGHGHHGHSSFVLGLSFLFPLYRYPPPVYDPPPPRVVYVERPPAAPVCRRFRGNATVDSSGARFYGTACLLADGRWHIVN